MAYLEAEAEKVPLVVANRSGNPRVTVWAKNVQRILSPRDYERVARQLTAYTSPMSRRTSARLFAMALLLFGCGLPDSQAEVFEPRLVFAQGTPQGPYEEPPATKGKSPEEKMNMRFPQPVKVGDLIGLPVLDDYDLTIGYVRRVVRTPQGKIQLDRDAGWLARAVVWLGRTLGRGPDRGGCNPGSPDRRARYAEEGIFRRADLV